MSKPRIFIVEDEVIVAEDLKIHLTQMGYEVAGHAISGGQALALVGADRPDLVLMDIRLQGAMDGIGTAREMRERFRLPVVFLTAHAESVTFQQAKEVGPYGYILKPFEDRDLNITIEMALYKHRTEGELRVREQRLGFLITSTSAVIYTCRATGDFASTYVSGNVESLLGHPAGEFTQHPGFWKSHIHPEDAERLDAVVNTVINQGSADCEYRFLHRDGTYRWLHDRIRVLHDVAGQPAEMIGSLIDITARKQTELYLEISREVLLILNDPGELQDSIQRVLAVLKVRTGFDAVGLRLQDGEDFPYYAQQGFPPEFLSTENTLLGQAADSGMCLDCNGKARLECTCGLVISGRTDPANPLYTRGGSAWTNNSHDLLNMPAGQDLRFRPRNQCAYHGYASVALVPIRHKDAIVGLIQFNDRRKGCFTLKTVELLEDIATHTGAALMRMRAEESLRQATADLHALSARMQAMRENERATIARDLHDTLGQQLTSLQIGLMWMDHHLQSVKPPDFAELYDRIVAMVPVVERLTEQTQTICTSLRPAVLSDLGLLAAIEWQAADTANRSGLMVTLALPEDEEEEIELDPDLAMALFRIVQEVLTNVVRHAQATQVEIRLHRAGNEMAMDIQDNGRGIEAAACVGPKALGLLGMRERAGAFGGTVEFSGVPGVGTTVRVRVPCGAKVADPQ